MVRSSSGIRAGAISTDIKMARCPQCQIECTPICMNALMLSGGMVRIFVSWTV
jgi:hypothetical protein